MLLLFFACVYVVSTTVLKTGITSIFRPADSLTTDFTEKFDDAIYASMGFCVKSSNLWDGNTPREYYCNIAPLLDEWSNQHENEYCWMAVGQFITPPNPFRGGAFVPKVKDLMEIDGMSLDTHSAMIETYFQRYPQIIYAGSRSIEDESTHQLNTLAILAIRLGNSTRFFDDWKSNAHCPNIRFAAEAHWGSPWKGKVFRCNKYIGSGVHSIFTDNNTDPNGIDSDQAVKLLHTIENEFNTSLLDEAVERGESMGIRINVSSISGGLQISISNIPVSEWFAVGYTKTGTMPGSKVMIFDNTADGRPAYIKGYDADTIDFSPSSEDLKLTVVDYSSRNVYQSAVIKLEALKFNHLQIVYSWGKDGSKMLGYHGGNKAILDIPAEIRDISQNY